MFNAERVVLWRAGARYADPWWARAMPYLMDRSERVDRVAAAAVHVIETEGLGALSVRRIAGC